MISCIRRVLGKCIRGGGIFGFGVRHLTSEYIRMDDELSPESSCRCFHVISAHDYKNITLSSIV